MDPNWLLTLCLAVPIGTFLIIWAVASAAKDSYAESRDRFNL